MERPRSASRLPWRKVIVATTGSSERKLVVDGVPFSHILDPRSGAPVPEWGAVTVVAPDGVSADCISTALYVMGPRLGGRWIAGRPGFEAVFVEIEQERLHITATVGLRESLKLPPDRTVKWLEPAETEIDCNLNPAAVVR